MKHILFLSILTVLSGCSTRHNGRGWGESATFLPGWQSIKSGFIQSASDPVTYIPAISALVLSVGDTDQKITKWASEKNPVFGSKTRALNYSDNMLNLLRIESIATMVMMPSGEEWEKHIYSKTKGIVVELSAISLNSKATDEFKKYADRTRPNKESSRSFPSGHTSKSFTRATLASQNLAAIATTRRQKRLSHAINITGASSVAWARVEGNMHFPSDVLAGAAMGNFIANFFCNTFISNSENIQPVVNLTKGTKFIAIKWNF